MFPKMYTCKTQHENNAEGMQAEHRNLRNMYIIYTLPFSGVCAGMPEFRIRAGAAHVEKMRLAQQVAFKRQEKIPT